MFDSLIIRIGIINAGEQGLLSVAHGSSLVGLVERYSGRKNTSRRNCQIIVFRTAVLRRLSSKGPGYCEVVAIGVAVKTKTRADNRQACWPVTCAPQINIEGEKKFRVDTHTRFLRVSYTFEDRPYLPSPLTIWGFSVRRAVERRPLLRRS